jgi:hypothetical protein
MVCLFHRLIAPIMLPIFFVYAGLIDLLLAPSINYAALVPLCSVLFLLAPFLAFSNYVVLFLSYTGTILVLLICGYFYLLSLSNIGPRAPVVPMYVLVACKYYMC